MRSPAPYGAANSRADRGSVAQLIRIRVCDSSESLWRLRPYIVNWEEVAADMTRRLHQEIDWVPTDTVLQSLLAEVLSYPDVPEQWRTRELEVPMLPIAY